MTSTDFELKRCDARWIREIALLETQDRPAMRKRLVIMASIMEKLIKHEGNQLALMYADDNFNPYDRVWVVQRFRKGRLMAEGGEVFAETGKEAIEVAKEQLFKNCPNDKFKAIPVTPGVLGGIVIEK